MVAFDSITPVGAGAVAVILVSRSEASESSEISSAKLYVSLEFVNKAMIVW